MKLKSLKKFNVNSLNMMQFSKKGVA